MNRRERRNLALNLERFFTGTLDVTLLSVADGYHLRAEIDRLASARALATVDGSTVRSVYVDVHVHAKRTGTHTGWTHTHSGRYYGGHWSTGGGLSVEGAMMPDPDSRQSQCTVVTRAMTRKP